MLIPAIVHGGVSRDYLVQNGRVRQTCNVIIASGIASGADNLGGMYYNGVGCAAKPSGSRQVISQGGRRGMANEAVGCRTYNAPRVGELGSAKCEGSSPSGTDGLAFYDHLVSHRSDLPAFPAIPVTNGSWYAAGFCATANFYNSPRVRLPTATPAHRLYAPVRPKCFTVMIRAGSNELCAELGEPGSLGRDAEPLCSFNHVDESRTHLLPFARL